MRRWLPLLSLLVACDPELVDVPKTQLILRVHASADVQRLGSVLVLDAGEPNPRVVSFRDVSRWPADVLVVPAEGAPRDAQVELIARAYNARDVLLWEDRARTAFVPREARIVELRLEACGERALGDSCEVDPECEGPSCLRCRDARCVATGETPGTGLPKLDVEADIPDDPSPACPAEGCGALCNEGSQRCAGDVLEACQPSGLYATLPACPQFCFVDGCDTGHSCSENGRCGANESCCAAKHVPGGTFKRSYDGVDLEDDTHPASVRPFVLDRFEVTVARMRTFLKRWDSVAAQTRPRAGAGKSRDPDDGGWDASWDAFLPASREEAEAWLRECPDATYDAATVTRDIDERPVNCVTWYMAQAFCIWEGGRLPTEAEWNFAAAGGAEQRVYPWSVPADAVAIDATRAVFDTALPRAVGSLSPAGDARYGHADLAGNLSEWVLDVYRPAYEDGPCDDCVQVAPDRSRVLRGGNFAQAAESLRAGVRTSLGANTSSEEVGFRCARPLE